MRVRIRSAAGATSSASAGRAASTSLLDAKTGPFIWNTLHRPGRRSGRHGVGHGIRRRTHLRLDHEPPPHSLHADGERRDLAARPSPAARGRRSIRRRERSSGKPPIRRSRPCTGVGVVGVWDLAPVTVANGVAVRRRRWRSSRARTRCSHSTPRPGTSSGSSAPGSSVNAGPAVVNGSVYWGSGYRQVRRGGQRERPVLRVQHRPALAAGREHCGGPRE